MAWVWLGFALYCLGSGSRWIADQGVPSPLPGLLRVGVDQALLFGVWAGWCVVRRPAGMETLRRIWWKVALLAGAVFVLPDAVIEGADGAMNGLSESLMFTLVPVVVVFAVAQDSFEFGLQADPRRLLGPALAGVFGAAFLIPFSTPPTLAGKLWLVALAASIVFAGVAALRLHALLQGVPVVAAAALVSGAMAAIGLAFSRRDGTVVAALVASPRALGAETLRTLWLEAPLLLLGMWALRDLPPLAVVTRYPLVLLVTIVESYFLLHARANWIMIGGGLLMAGSAAWLLRASVSRDAAADQAANGAGREDDSGSTPVR